MRELGAPPLKLPLLISVTRQRLRPLDVSVIHVQLLREKTSRDPCGRLYLIVSFSGLPNLEIAVHNMWMNWTTSSSSTAFFTTRSQPSRQYSAERRSPDVLYQQVMSIVL